MQTVEAIYEDGKIFFIGEKIDFKAKVRLTVLEKIKSPKKKISLPELHLGEIKKIDRKDIYEDYLSD